MVTSIESNSNKYDDIIQKSFPNPFNSTTIFRFEVSGQSVVNLYILDITGKIVKRLVNSEPFSSGTYEKSLWESIVN